MAQPCTTSLHLLSTECRSASGPSRLLDIRIWVQIGWTHGGDGDEAWRRQLLLSPSEIVMGSVMADAMRVYPDDVDGIARNWRVPELTASRDAAASILGDDEDPFVLSTLSDFGGLRRARVSDGLRVQISADAATIPLATLAAGLDAMARRIELGLSTPTRSWSA